MLPTQLAFVDIETTGFRSNFDRIIEIGIVVVENNRIIEKFETLLNPECYFPDEIEILTGITRRDVEKAPLFTAVRRDIHALLKDALFVAHNVRFDYSFLKNEFKREEMTFSAKQLCTVKLSRALFPEQRRHNLDAIIERFQISCKRRHRAFDDAYVLWEFYQGIQKLFPEEVLINALNKVSKKPSIPVHLTEEDLTDLPKTSGVYIFYDRDNTPLYIGKSKTLKARIQSHFQSDHASSTEMKISQQVTRITTMKTPGELGALVKESQLIKELQPMYNRKLRRAQKLTAAVKTNIDGYDSVSLQTLDCFTPALLRNIVGFFRSQKQAKDYFVYVGREYKLCDKLLGVEKTNFECFGYRLGRCLGACRKQENPAFYNVRFLQAFSTTRLKPWPFDGPVAIVEGNDTDIQTFILNNWCLENIIDGEYREIEEELCDTKEDDTIPFDLDIYKIFKGFLSNPKNVDNIIQLKKRKTTSHSPFVAMPY